MLMEDGSIVYREDVVPHENKGSSSGGDEDRPLEKGGEDLSLKKGGKELLAEEGGEEFPTDKEGKTREPGESDKNPKEERADGRERENSSTTTGQSPRNTARARSAYCLPSME